MKNSNGVWIILVCLVIIGFAFCSRTPSTSQAGGAMDGYYAGQSFVKKHLKAPSSAKFSNPYSDDGASFQRRVDENTFHVGGWVDSQNGFGAMIRTTWEAQVSYAGSGRNWNLDWLQIGAKTVYGYR